MTPFARGVLADLRSRRLLPVAIVLAVALLAVPVLLRESPAPPALVTDAAQPSAATAPGGLPSPDAALEPAPLVTMASLERPSALRSFDTRDPFEPLQTMAQVAQGQADEEAADPGSRTGGSSVAPDVTISGGIGNVSVPDVPIGPTGGDAPASPDPEAQDPEQDRDEPDREPEPRPEPEPGTYAVDVSFAGPEQARQVRGLPRLAMLPHASVPLLIFLGVSDGGGEALFLIDSKLSPQEGEGTCLPSLERCATLGLEPGERQTFIGDEGGTYLLQLDQIRAISVEEAIRRRRASDARAARTESEPRPFLPVLVDILTLAGD